jgi:SAM-dependent methyltransferase
MFIIQKLRNFLIRFNRYILRKFIRFLNSRLKVSEKANLGLSEIDYSPVNQRENVILASKYDMFTAAGENFYSDQYWQLIREFITVEQDRVRILDLGSGQGRMVQKFLDNLPNANILCCDISEKAISELKFNITVSPTQKVIAAVSPYEKYLESLDSSSIDIVLFTEVSFYSPDWEKSLSDVYRVLKPGGIFVSSHRSRYFNVMLLLSLGHFEAALRILKTNSGRLFGTTGLLFSWNDSFATREILEVAGFSVEKITGLGVSSGIKGDPHELLAEPGRLSKDDLSALMQLEKHFGGTVPDSGRYMLFVAKKH